MWQRTCLVHSLSTYFAYLKYSIMETSVYWVHTPQASQFIANVAIPGRSPITSECITHTIQRLALSSPPVWYSGFVNYITSGPAAIHIHHINSDQKHLVSINTADLLLQIIMTWMSTEFEMSRGHWLAQESRKIPEEFWGLCKGTGKREGRIETAVWEW